MAEPEDVEEDLFADLYDADENANHTTTSAVEPSPITHPISDTSAQTAGVAASHPVQSFQAQPDDVNSVYQNTQFNGGQHNGADTLDSGFAHNSVATTSGDSEPQGTGIKEDG